MASLIIRIISISACLAIAGAAQSQEAVVGGDFSFKRVGIPKTSTGKRITVQIDPNKELYRLTPGSQPRRPGDPRPESATAIPDALIPTEPTDFDWYWDTVSPSRTADAGSRFREAIAMLSRSGDRLRAPRLQALRNIANNHGVDILTATIGTEVSPALVLAVIAVESAGRLDAVSHAGAQGLMQLMPATASRFGVTDSNNARQNIQGGVAYLDWLLKEFDRDPVMALAGYNAGEGAVAKYAGVPPFAETRGYVPKVLAAWLVAKGLCMTPPELVTDGCVFIPQQVASDG